jgi:DNA-binding GntR family transcriptional regulator
MADAKQAAARADKEGVYATLIERILGGDLEPGAALSERALVERYGISRTPIRQVLWRLERDDLVEIRPHRGAFVKRMGADDIRDLFQLREALEPLASSLAAVRRPSDELRVMKTAFAELERDEKPSVRQLIRQGQALHDAVVRWSGNRMLVRIYEVMSLQTQLMRNLLRASSASERLSLREHVAIVAALERRDPAAALEAMRTHLRRARTTILAELFHPVSLGPTASAPNPEGEAP